MALTERRRQDMFQAMETTMGKEPALTLLEHLPPVGWADVATKQDLSILEMKMDVLDARINGRITALESKFDGRISALESDLRSYVDEKLRQTTLSIMAMNLALFSAFFALVKLT